MRYKAIVQYDGTNYSGWQIQKNAASIQQCLVAALQRLTGQQITVHGSGRTDGHVHAKGQVFHFDTDKCFKDIRHAINSQLPDDIYIVDCKAVEVDFHARFSAKWKHYDYLVKDDGYDPLLRHYCAFTSPVDLEKMEAAKEIFTGTHDFTSFNATKLTEMENQVRTVYRIDIAREKDYIRLSFYGDGFMRYMVRMMAQCLIEAGKGNVTPQDLNCMMEAKDKNACHFNGSPNGLYLVEVGYSEFI